MSGSLKDYIDYRISKSHEIFEDAVLLSDNERWNSCMNRLYYSSYYLASALLFKNKIKAETHNGVKTQLFLNFIKNNLLDTKHGKLYSHLFAWRQEADYSDFVDFEKETVLPIIKQVRNLNTELLRLIQK